ncbi:MAG: MarR family winged helix-turn-helix transcriptional regulator [Planctomycetes bacterium]|nr:MarR family winged helix-turn-helix transcriptional regulator [Planctomycetota bacterium]
MISPSKPNKALVATDSAEKVETSDTRPLSERRGIDPAVLEQVPPLTAPEKSSKQLSAPAKVPTAVRDASSSAAKEIGGACIGFRLRLLDRVVARIYDDALRAHELRRTQLDLLAALQRFGPASPGQLIRILGLEKSSLSRNLRRLIKRGLGAELPGADRRCHLLDLTELGHNQLSAALPDWRHAQANVEELLGDESGEAIRRMARHYWQSANEAARQ